MQTERETTEVLGRIACQIVTMLPDNHDDALRVLDMVRDVRACLSRYQRNPRTDALSAVQQANPTSAVVLPIRRDGESS